MQTGFAVVASFLCEGVCSGLRPLAEEVVDVDLEMTSSIFETSVSPSVNGCDHTDMEFSPASFDTDGVYPQADTLCCPVNATRGTYSSEKHSMITPC